jgi:hypothetical protein
MRTSIFAMIVVAGSPIAFSATAQERQAAPSEQLKAQMKRDVDEGLKSNAPSQQMQRDADKAAITRNSGESGLRSLSRQAGCFCPSSRRTPDHG